MCRAISWIEKNGELLYITGADLKTKRGKMLIKHCQDPDDYKGHGAIRYFFGNEKPDGTIELMIGGEEHEVDDFASPKNFPKEIAEAVRWGKFRSIWCGVAGLLRAPLYADYGAKCDLLYADYEAKRDALYADYRAKRNALYADYRAKRNALYADYRAKRDALFWDLFAINKNRAGAWQQNKVKP